MNILKYCKRISKETNIGFIAIWVISPMYDLFVRGLWDWVTFIGYTLCMITVYFSMIFIIKVLVWDRGNKNN